MGQLKTGSSRGQTGEKECRSTGGTLTGPRKKQNGAPTGNMLLKNKLTMIRQAVTENTFQE